ncbi:hypothetical protein [Pseudorhodoplanes sinuspersici]|uniref:Uncharacterized protein n=1 Tax=Pseudorhodoplanes sinuspersici TaxID=1235591 RepID=A0A1W6ZPW4_9HYPH|nr:hypothetical protein [Pseudorhodoplanes sinuspersici]ARP99433.1 hypothetical protein CAK95_10300 [Pseudorhodoplanes sinuspersici]RKE70377.1 hypothetical protein DFP91_2608 [Pseudorhodoplanes sinuspersici]
MYLVGFPLLLIPLALYNIIAFLFGLGFGDTVFTVPMMSGATLSVSTGDLLIILSILLLFVEILKATRFGVKSIVDHLLSFVVFVVALGEFLMVQQAATSTFLLFLVICAIDVVGGFSISIRAAARDYTVDGTHPIAH